MKVSDTIIKWQLVNMRAENKNLPEQGKNIVYYNQGICTSIVSKNSKGQLCVNVEFKRQDIKSGFLWCYQNDIAIPQEID